MLYGPEWLYGKILSLLIYIVAYLRVQWHRATRSIPE